MRRFAFLIALLAVPALADPAKLFNDNCSACHTVGGGDGAGPDLIRARAKSADELKAAIKRMEDNVGPLTAEQVDGLILFIKTPAPVVQVAEKPRGSADTGRKLFFGEQKLANGGSPCFACHAVDGRGGNLAVDLTSVHSRRSTATLLAAATKPGFPLMKAAYSHAPVTDQEAQHLVAFFESRTTAVAAKSSAEPFHLAAAGFAFIVLGGVALITRKPGARRRLVNRKR